MKNRTKFIVSSRLATSQKEICEVLLLKSKAHVINYAKKVGMAISHCVWCGTDSPTIITIKEDCCSYCGSNKLIQERY
jgi:hypothetical protein